MAGTLAACGGGSAAGPSPSVLSKWCSWLTDAQVKTVLGGPSIVASPSGGLCIYGGPAGSMIVVQVRQSSLPLRGTHVIIDDVDAGWVAPGSLIRSVSTGSANPLSGILSFRWKSYLVSVTIYRGTKPEAQAKEAMTFILQRL